jgi:hypothetical protein
MFGHNRGRRAPRLASPAPDNVPKIRMTKGCGEEDNLRMRRICRDERFLVRQICRTMLSRSRLRLGQPSANLRKVTDSGVGTSPQLGACFRRSRELIIPCRNGGARLFQAANLHLERSGQIRSMIRFCCPANAQRVAYLDATWRQNC